MNEAIQKKCATAVKNDEFILVETYSGLRMIARDPDGEQVHLSANPEPRELGRAVLAALSKSRVLTLEESNSFFDWEVRKKDYEEWVSRLMKKYGYTRRRHLFRKMMSLNIVCSGGTISFQPTFHEKLEGWSGTGLGGDDHVHVPETASELEIGEGALLALSRCAGRSF